VIGIILRKYRESRRHKISAVFLRLLYKVLDGYKTVNGEMLYMKRQKRDKLDRAHSNGYQAGLLAERSQIPTLSQSDLVVGVRL
jgi:hypothetical protein